MFRAIHQRFDELAHQLDRIDLILTLKDPGSTKAADAYEGLRRQIIASSQERLAHLAHLARIDAALKAGESADDLALLLRELLNEAGLVHVVDPSDPDLFEVAGEGEQLTVTAPAYVEAPTGRLIRQGRVRASALQAVQS